MTKAAGPQELPEWLLTDPAMVAACATRDFGAIFILVRNKAGIYPSRIARLCDLTPSRVGEVIKGQRAIENIKVIERIADGLRIPGRMLGLAARTWETPAVLAEPSAPTTAALPTAAPPLDIGGATLPGSELDDILALAATSRPSPSTLRALQASIEDYWRRDDQHGGEVLRPAVIGQLRYVLSLLSEATEPNFRRSLHAIAAELARLTGWTYFDARQYSTARGYFTQALRLAQAIDDRPFIANVMACLSLQATYQDKPADAVALSHAAQDNASQEGGTPRVLAMLSMREAFAHATLRDSHATHAALKEAHEQFERATPGDDDPAWVRYFDRTKLTVDTGIALGQLGDAKAAEPLILQALQEEHGTNLRGRAFHSFWLARVQLQRRAVDEACTTAAEALSLASSVDSARVRGHLREFRQDLTPFRDAPAVTVFESRMRAALS